MPRHTGGQRVEFGRQVTRDEILAHPTEHGQAAPAVEHHQALFEHPSGLVTGDRGVHADTEARLRQLGVKHVAIPASGAVSEARRAEERTRTFHRGYRFRAGTRGLFASRRRDSGWRVYRSHGLDGMEDLLRRIVRTLREHAQQKGGEDQGEQTQ